MLYSEFVAGTGCRETDHNYKIYKDLEVMYMNSDISKAEVYEYGKKLVDNSKTEAEIRIEESVKAEIAELRNEIAQNNDTIQRYKEYCLLDMQNGDKQGAKAWKENVRMYQHLNNQHRHRIQILRHWFLAA